MIDNTTFSILVNIMNVLFICYLIFVEKKNYRSLFIWISIFLIFPIGGWILFFFFGRGPMLFFYKKEDYYQTLTLYNHLQIFTDGKSFYDDLMEEIKKAKSTIHIESYIFRDDRFTKELMKELYVKLKEGVKVRIVYDPNANLTNDRNQFVEFIKLGGKVYPYYKGIFKILNFNYRNHRKIIVIDGKLGYLGGFNLGIEYLSKHPRITPWRDSQIKIKGECVYVLQKEFLKDYNFAKKSIQYEDNLDLIKEKYSDRILPIDLVSFCPKDDFNKIKETYMSWIYGAKSLIQIQTPYLVPDIGIMNAIKTALHNKVKVEIMIPRVYDKLIPYFGTLEYVKELFDLGAKVYFYEGFIHAKTLLVDDEKLSIGSVNLDVRSMYHNFELTALIYGKEQIYRHKNIFSVDVINSLIYSEEFEKKELKKYRLGQKIFKLLSVLM
ncbi:MAG: phospholipase D-like domain-containing protein [Bacillales bacterium]|nr:phospholipase D-like domain-containing protein [Bacillales bacterium]